MWHCPKQGQCHHHNYVIMIIRSLPWRCSYYDYSVHSPDRWPQYWRSCTPPSQRSSLHKMSPRTRWLWSYWWYWWKSGFGHNFWLEGPIDLRTTHLNYILQDLFRDTPFDHIWRAHCPSMHPKYCIYPIRPYLGMYLRNFSHHYTCRWYVPFQGVGMSGAEPVVSRHCPLCLSWRGDPSAHKWGRSPSRQPLFSAVLWTFMIQMILMIPRHPMIQRGFQSVVW